MPWEDAVGEAYKHKNLATKAEQKGWRTKVLHVEVGCRGFYGHVSHQIAERDGSLRTGPPTGYQVTG